jgi:hypothetical protein
MSFGIRRCGVKYSDSVVIIEQFGGNGMTKNILRIGATVCTALLCSVMLAQDPVQNINPKLHANLAKAQELSAEANRYIIAAQKDNRYDMHGHASKARQLLVQVNEELKAAAEDANAAKK